MSSFSLKDSIVNFQKAQPLGTPAGMSGTPAGPLVRLYGATQMTFDPGGKASYVKGSGITPTAIVIGTAEGKLEFDCSNATETGAIRKAMGGVGSLCIVSVNLVRTGMTPDGYLFLPCVWENGGGFAGDDGKGFADKIMLKFIDAFLNGTSVYNKLA